MKARITGTISLAVVVPEGTSSQDIIAAGLARLESIFSQYSKKSQLRTDLNDDWKVTEEHVDLAKEPAPVTAPVVAEPAAVEAPAAEAASPAAPLGTLDALNVELSASGESPFTAEELEAMFVYLDDLRESGETNMYGARPYVEQQFSLNKRVAGKVLSAWMKSFEARHPQTA